MKSIFKTLEKKPNEMGWSRTMNRRNEKCRKSWRD